MPRIQQDPNALQCPDYDLAEHAQTVQLLINGNTDAAQAAQILKNIWQINNDKEKANWQLQVDADLAETQARLLQQQLDDTAKEEESAQELDAHAKEERKRNKDKYLPIPLDRGIPMQPHDVLSSYAVKKLEKGEYIPLWYVTNEGLDSARRSNVAADSNSMVMVINDDGTNSWQTTAQPARGVLDDEDLPWEVVCTSCSLLVTAAANAGWTDDRIDILSGFFGGIITHPWRGSRDLVERRALQVYMAEQRRLWHASIGSSIGGYNISMFNHQLLRDTYERVYRRERTKLDEIARKPNPPAQADRSHTSRRHERNERSEASRHRSRSPERSRPAPHRGDSDRGYGRPRQPSPGFRAGASKKVLAACALCLGRFAHKVNECRAQNLWDGRAPTAARRIGNALEMRDGRTLCMDYQIRNGCSRTDHDIRHFCTGCGQSAHGAQECPRAEKC